MEERDRKDLEINELREQMNKMQKDLQDIKEFELAAFKESELWLEETATGGCR